MNEAALKARLKFIAQKKLKTFNEVWKQLLLERFLARLSHSAYREQFIFKGGSLLAQLRGLGDIRKKLDLPDQISDLLAEVNGWLINLQKTINSMREAEHGQLESFKTVKLLMDNLNDNND